VRETEIREDYKIDYKVVYTRRRSIGISIGPDSGVTVRAPYRTSLKTIESVIQSKSAWIFKHTHNYKSAKRINDFRSVTDRSTVFFRGKEYLVRITDSKENSVDILLDHILVGLKNIEEKDKAGIILEKWFRTNAEKYLKEKFEEILLRFKSYNFAPSEFAVRSLKRRWGSCSSRGKITISSELFKLDDIYLEYVILHELCHLRHHNHGKEFYKLLSEVFPDWKQRRSELKKFIR
jgi:predicted metal-dependent hydrolase